MACGNCGPSLPLTYTVRFSGLPENYTRTASCAISFESNFGSGAQAICTAPIGGEDDRGPMATIVVTNGGSCYARLGRVAPTLTATASRGSDAVFSVTLTESADGNGFAFWEVASVSVSGGTGYSDGQRVKIAFAAGDTVQLNAVVTLQASSPDGIPTGTTVVSAGYYYRESTSVPAYLANVTVSDGNCSGTFEADLSAVIDPDPESATFGQITSVAINYGGAGYLCTTYIDGDGNEICYSRLNSYDEIDRPWVLTAQIPRQLVGLCIRPSCFGGGASGSIDARSFLTGMPDPSPGPIPRVLLDDGGSGYALRARAMPTLEVLGSGTGATFTVTLEEQEDECGLPYWEIAGITVEEGNDDWTDGETLTVRGVTEDDKTGSPATVTLQTTRAAPTIESWNVGCGGGSGAQLTFHFDDDNENYWFITAVTVASGGSGYIGTEVCPPEYLPIELEFSEDDTVIANATLVATARDGKIVAVHVVDRGTFYRLLDTPRSVLVEDAGRFYRETDGSPYVADVIVDVDQERPSNGSGAAVSATVDSDINSPTFGRVTALTLTNGGSGYTLFGGGRVGRGGSVADFVNECPGGNYKRFFLSVDSDNCPPKMRLTLDGYGTFSGDLPCNGAPSTLTPSGGGGQGEVEVTETEPGDYENVLECTDECADCDEEVTVAVEWCDMAVSFSIPVPGASGFVEALNPPPESYMIVDATISCTNCGWALMISVCAYCAETNQFASDGFTAVIPFVDVEAPPQGNYCPQSGAVTLECFGEQFGIPCKTSATASVA